MYEIEQVQAYAFLIPIIWRRHLQGTYGALTNNPVAWLYQTTTHSLIVVCVATAKLHITIPVFVGPTLSQDADFKDRQAFEVISHMQNTRAQTACEYEEDGDGSLDEALWLLAIPSVHAMTHCDNTDRPVPSAVQLQRIQIAHEASPCRRRRRREVHVQRELVGFVLGLQQADLIEAVDGRDAAIGGGWRCGVFVRAF
jgi:hypothetical protein